MNDKVPGSAISLGELAFILPARRWQSAAALVRWIGTSGKSMAAVEMRSGLASRVGDNGAGMTFRIGNPPISVPIGVIATRAPAGKAGPLLIGEDEWTAVAVRRSA